MTPLRSLRKRAAPSSCCLPPAASGPVLTVRKPMRRGSDDCPNAPVTGNTPTAAPHLSKVRRDNLPLLRDILHSSGSRDMIAHGPGRRWDHAASHAHGQVSGTTEFASTTSGVRLFLRRTLEPGRLY